MISCGETPPIQLVHQTWRGEVIKGERALTVYDEKWQLGRGGGDRNGRQMLLLLCRLQFHSYPANLNHLNSAEDRFPKKPDLAGLFIHVYFGF